MTHPFPRAALLAAVLLVVGAVYARAQNLPASSRSLVPATVPRWDSGASIGFLAMSTSETRSPWNGWEQKADFRFDLGYYWTTHLKTDVAVTASNEWQDYDSELLAIPGVPRAYGYNNIDRRLYSVAPAVTWQFRENAMWHPYVSGGVKIGLLQEHTYRAATTQRIGTVSFAVPPLDERATVVLARPFAAAGFKSYFSRSVFTRTEARVALAQDGLRQVSLVIGFGVDF